MGGKDGGDMEGPSEDFRGLQVAAAALGAGTWSITVGFPWGISIGVSWP